LAPTVGIATTGFCYSGGILQLFRQDQKILQLPTEAAARSRLVGSHLVNSSSSSKIQAPTSFTQLLWHEASNKKFG
jgi:hypothetical protein